MSALRGTALRGTALRRAILVDRIATGLLWGIGALVVAILLAIIAHFLAWQWRPWLPGVDGYQKSSDALHAIQHVVTSMFT